MIFSILLLFQMAAAQEKIETYDYDTEDSELLSEYYFRKAFPGMILYIF